MQSSKAFRPARTCNLRLPYNRVLNCQQSLTRFEKTYFGEFQALIARTNSHSTPKNSRKRRTLRLWLAQRSIEGMTYLPLLDKGLYKQLRKMNKPDIAIAMAQVEHDCKSYSNRDSSRCIDLEEQSDTASVVEELARTIPRPSSPESGVALGSPLLQIPPWSPQNRQTGGEVLSTGTLASRSDDDNSDSSRKKSHTPTANETERSPVRARNNKRTFRQANSGE